MTKTIQITGASSGFGAMTAELARAGYATMRELPGRTAAEVAQAQEFAESGLSSRRYERWPPTDAI